MSKIARDNIHEQDKRWMVWLKAVSRRAGCSGKTLLEEYANDKDAWHDSVKHLRETKCLDWTFCRGSLSDIEIANTRERYLSQYVFVAGENCSQSYVDSLLTIEDAQISMRLSPDVRVKCESCNEQQITIRRLLAALSAREINTDDDIRLAALVSIFQRYFMLGEGYETPRRLVRRSIENVMQTEISADERLSPKSDLWHRFLSEALGERLHSSADLPCRYREPPISRDEFAANCSAVYPDLLSTYPASSRKKEVKRVV